MCLPKAVHMQETGITPEWAWQKVTAPTHSFITSLHALAGLGLELGVRGYVNLLSAPQGTWVQTHAHGQRASGLLVADADAWNGLLRLQVAL